MVNVIDNKNFYPTPEKLIQKMIAKIKGRPEKILEPSAGKGDIINGLTGAWESGAGFGTGYKFKHADILAIEIDPQLQATLRGHGFKLLDSDFLTFAGPDQFDLIIANPPFDEGDKHLLKAIDIMYRGQIIFLLNAETIRNPNTNTRKELVARLKKLGAKIEYIKDAFLVAERKTKVEVALVDITIERKVEDDLFAGCETHAARPTAKVKLKGEISTGRTLEELVAEYNEVIRIGTESIMNFYRNWNKVGRYLRLKSADDKNEPYYSQSEDTLTRRMQDALNELLKSVRTDFWRNTLKLGAVQSKMTQKKRQEFEDQLKSRAYMDFTYHNVSQFILNLHNGYEQTLVEAVLDIFDKFTIEHCYGSPVDEGNIHYFTGWKTNNAFKVRNRVVIPIRGCYGGPFQDFGKWKLNYAAAEALNDIDKVMNYFDGGDSYIQMSTALNNAFTDNPKVERMTGIESTYFKMTVHKKGTIHLTFRNEDILRRFNVVACRGRNWLPQDYGTKKYKDMTPEEQGVVEAFEGATSYSKNVCISLFRQNVPGIEYKQAA